MTEEKFEPPPERDDGEQDDEDPDEELIEKARARVEDDPDRKNALEKAEKRRGRRGRQ